jgi:uncharacterized SAM-binding protein YcdF (DUF218 family)
MDDERKAGAGCRVSGVGLKTDHFPAGSPKLGSRNSNPGPRPAARGPRVGSSFRVRRSAFVVLLAWPLIGWAAARGLVVSAPLAGGADAVAVLSGGEVYRERAEHAARLFREGRAPRVVLTNDAEPAGWSHERGRTMLFVERAQEALTRAGVPAAAIEVVPGGVTSTHDEAAALAEYARGRGWQTLLVVTSGYHSRRARWTLRRAARERGLTVGLEPASSGAGSPSPWGWWASARGWRMVAGEYAKLVYYRLRY